MIQISSLEAISDFGTEIRVFPNSKYLDTKKADSSNLVQNFPKKESKVFGPVKEFFGKMERLIF